MTRSRVTSRPPFGRAGARAASRSGRDGGCRNVSTVPTTTSTMTPRRTCLIRRVRSGVTLLPDHAVLVHLAVARFHGHVQRPRLHVLLPDGGGLGDEGDLLRRHFADAGRHLKLGALAVEARSDAQLLDADRL